MGGLLIGTHDSATGERGHGFVSWLLTPFARTQSKTIKEQYEAGCRCFDIRVRMSPKRGWVCAHGPWETERSATSILNELNDMPEVVQVELTYEGTTAERDLFESAVEMFEHLYPYIKWAARCIKYSDKKDVKVDYELVKAGDSSCKGGDRGYLPLDGRSWHTYLPIPWLWDRLYMRPHKFNENRYTWVDFL